MQAQCTPVDERAFLVWTNVQLAARKLQVESCSEFNNGLVLMNLLEIVFKKSIGRRFNLTLRPITQEQREENTLLCLNFLHNEGVSPSTKELAEEICSKNAETQKLAVLQTLWNIIKYWRILIYIPKQTEDVGSYFMSWVHHKILVRDTSWTTGTGFYDLCSKFSGPLKRDNQSLAEIISLMESDFGLPKGLVVAHEFASNPSESVLFIILSYIIQYRILQFQKERQESIIALHKEERCLFSKLPIKYLKHLARTNLEDSNIWLFINTK
eukprot:TRINITY_DN14430_c0_g1_i1.p1 TRINITY_DN14430_c0_g1~~TRINITY_DN14430_c0_g1_i1.p1  ORF type:complete len:269 (-),score=38.71 TRINITY_DN14430_c0_g1_i1:210-1016(-)